MLKLTPYLLFIASLIISSKVNAFDTPEASDTLTIDGSTGVKPLVQALAHQYQSQTSDLKIEIGAGLSPDRRIKTLSNGTIDIAMASHGFDTHQLVSANLSLHPLAKVAVVIGVNHSVSIDSLSKQQLCDIYSGAITNWQQLGGNNLPIVPFIRPQTEVDTEVLNAHIPCFAELAFASSVQVKNKSGQMARAIANELGAIGVTTLVRVSQSERKIKTLGLSGIYATTSNLITGRYPLTRHLYLITQAKPPAKVREFLNFIDSEQGKAVITTNLAIPFTGKDKAPIAR